MNLREKTEARKNGTYNIYDDDIYCDSTYMHFNSIEDLNLFLQSSSQYPKLKKITINFECNKEVYENLKSIPTRFKGRQIDISFSVNKLNIPDAENLIEFEELLDKNNAGKVLISSDLEYTDYTLSETLSAQAKANDIVDKLKKSDLSPFEKYMYIYNFLTTKVYHESEEDKINSRSLISVLNGNDIVCVGYANLMKYLCEEVGIPCEVQEVSLMKNNGDQSYHANNVVCIDDDKYNIHGIFYADSCWDSSQIVKNKELGRSLNYCLIPLSDKDSFKKTNIVINKPFDFLYHNVGNEMHFFNSVVNSIFYMDSVQQKSILKMADRKSKYIDEVKCQAKDIVNDDKRVTAACDLLEKLFKENNVKDNVYDGFNLHLHECSSMETLLGLCMSKNPDIELINHNIQILKDPKNHHKKSILTAVSDKWKEMTGKRAKLDIKYSIKDELANYRKNDNTVLKERLADTVMGIKFSMDITNDLYHKTQAKPIAVSAYAKAIQESCKLDGMTAEQARQEAKGYFDRTEKMLSHIFKENAQNDFYKSEMEILNRKQNENKKSVDLEEIQSN